MSALTQAMNEYGEAVRDDWSTIDGRDVRRVMWSFVEEIEHPRPARTIEWWRIELGICPAGRGHWSGPWGYCDDACLALASPITDSE